MYSPYFHRMFSSNFVESTAAEVPVAVDYQVLLEILRIVHQIGKDFSPNGQKQYEPEMLEQLYRAADMLDFPLIRKLCLDQLLGRPSVASATTVLRLDLHDPLMELFKKMNAAQVQRFLSEEDSNTPFFSKRDIAIIVEKTRARALRLQFIFPKPEIVELAAVMPYIAEPRIDLIRKWDLSDVAITSKNSATRTLYSNKMALAMASPYFRQILLEGKESKVLSSDPSSQFKDMVVLLLDVEFTTMKQILMIIHHCYKGPYEMKQNFHPAFLYDLYRTAAEDQLDIPMIRDFVTDCLLYNKKKADALDVAIQLDLTSVRNGLTIKMTPGELHTWLFTAYNTMGYHKDGDEVNLHVGRTQPALGCVDVYNVMAALRE